MPANSGAPASAGTRDIKVQRIEEGLPGLATVENPNAQPPSFQTLDAAIAGGPGAENPSPVAYVDTTETSGITPSAAVKRSKPTAWG